MIDDGICPPKGKGRGKSPKDTIKTAVYKHSLLRQSLIALSLSLWLI